MNRRLKMADKIVCDDWATVKHRTQTVSRCYKAGEISDVDIHANIADIVLGKKAARERDDEFIYFNAVGLAYVDVSIAHAMFKLAETQNSGRILDLQNTMIFDKNLKGKIRL